jgi:general secretion pathway protein M
VSASVRQWLTDNRGPAVLVGLTIALPLTLLIYLISDFWLMRGDYQGEIERLQPRIARLRGLIESEQRLESAADTVQGRLQNLVYPASEERTAVSAALQNSVREIMSDAGLSVLNSQVLPVVKEERFERIGIKLTLAGDIAALDTALADVTTYVPLLLVESLEIWPERQSRGREREAGQTLNANLQLLSLRALP